MRGNYLYSCLTAVVLLVSSVLGATVEQFAAEVAKSGHNIIQLTDSNYKKWLGGTHKVPRGANVLALFTTTALEFGCQTCLKFEAEYDALVQSWFNDHPGGVSKEDPEKALFFVKVSVMKPGQIPNAFKYFNLEHIPKLLFFPAGGRIDDYQSLDLPQEEGTMRVTYLITALKGAIGISDYQLYVPTDWSSIGVTMFAVFALVYLVRKHYAFLGTLLASRALWAVCSVAFIILMISGYMFNKIRGVPLAGSGPHGEVVYILENEFQSQYGIETQILAVFYGLLAALVVGLSMGIPKLNNYYQRRSDGTFIVAVASIVLAVAVYMFFAAYTNVYSTKQGGYPFKLFKVSALF
ncbi:dolichyl-diphosphooligosaccharide--protein glycotransferase OST3 KNAG_0E01620 [Huiozyma naganishii CBS 8797]|uniref:Dolichyl-diphosphooligosaccharide--protein glycosyltransferase subunit 3 n=1 Tax=Huiozyma naganishii (strain ATCC MYA-139 / BCRC 22969 / CBS 8797 / KCTC 17520 / NBRC 10181 / NCYC 3082 / Yp74L-3) TaxID=1071383 RepID=J7S6J6_HUIN7|nr:hypothetical protein KNAG_0E01620 [Kazachstania naganishii CBS 8797]CCK70424.1 hypothetical protein KNAG_0E01620 [Kazachstania naganishii CBS 8797]